MKFLRIKSKEDRFSDKGYDILDFLRDFISCIAIMALAGAWTLLCLLILSFIFIRWIPFHMKWMVPAAIAVGLVSGVVYIIRRVIRYRRQNGSGD